MSVFRVAHLTTVDLSLRFLVRPQLLAVVEAGGEAVGISSPGPWVEALEQDGIRHIPLSASTRGMSPLRDLQAAAQLWRILRREDITILHTHNPKPGLYGRVLGRLAGVPLVVNTLHGFYATEDDPLLKRVVVYGLEAIAARFSDIELHQNREDLALARKLWILPRGKGALLGNGVDLSRFDAGSIDSDARARVRRELGVADDEIVVGIVGRLVAEKGYPELFEAFAEIDDRFRLVVVGPDDPDKPDALPRSMITAASDNGVVFLGMRTDVEDLYAAMDVFVLPSHREGFPRAAMEAAAMGLPIVATDIRGCREVVIHGVNGMLVPVLDAQALARALLQLGDDTDLRTKMGEESRSLAKSQFDEQRVVEIVIDSYRDGLTAKGLGHLLPSSLLPDDEVGPVRPARAHEARAIAGLHLTELTTGFLPRLGLGFMTLLYRAMIEWPGAVVLVVDDPGGPIGFVAGVSDTGSFYRYFVRKYGLRAALSALPKLILNLKRAWESLRYGSDEGEEGPSAELLAIAVAKRARGKGLSILLGTEFLQRLTDAGCEEVKVVVAEQNATAIGAYRKLGFEHFAKIEVHRGEVSEVMVWRA